MNDMTEIGESATSGWRRVKNWITGRWTTTPSEKQPANPQPEVFQIDPNTGFYKLIEQNMNSPEKSPIGYALKGLERDFGETVQNLSVSDDLKLQIAKAFEKGNLEVIFRINEMTALRNPANVEKKLLTDQLRDGLGQMIIPKDVTPIEVSNFTHLIREGATWEALITGDFKKPVSKEQSAVPASFVAGVGDSNLDPDVKG